MARSTTALGGRKASAEHAAPHLAPGTTARRLRVEAFRCDALEDAEPHALALTYWFEAATQGTPYPVTVRFDGRRVGVRGKPGPRDTFTRTATVDQVVPGSGRIALTTRVVDVAPGEWHVTASPVREPGRRYEKRSAMASVSSSGTTGFAPVLKVKAPGVRLGAWPALVGVGVVIALVVQHRLAIRLGLDGARVLLVSLAACVVGLVGAKLYYLVEHRGSGQPAVTAGLCIQGFVIGAIGTVIVGGLFADVSVGRLLDATAPGLLFAMTVGRFGCFFGGCCAGRPTASRWGLWSSDRRLGVRRIPTQLLESTVAFVVGLAALFLVWTTPPDPAGTVFVGAIAAYTFGRQLLFPLRDLPRHTTNGRALTMALAALVVAVDVAVAVAI